MIGVVQTPIIFCFPYLSCFMPCWVRNLGVFSNFLRKVCKIPNYSLSLRHILLTKTKRNMKKLCLLVLCFSVSIVVYSQTLQRAILSHEGTLTQYDGDHWLDAIDNAVADLVLLKQMLFIMKMNLRQLLPVVVHRLQVQ